jgi:hypothetical protein
MFAIWVAKTMSWRKQDRAVAAGGESAIRILSGRTE